ncbi:ROK family protein [Peristeroidobacter soli]|jgi:fructokinase|uniref:ROK family protein n=1 Tax=Peristeroidobacter soli TaxID=2497877 RepID=UPI00101C441E|nr:ROK family protein [Peristeroidobacter soli]
MSSAKNALFGGIEAGGTKFVCAIGDADGRVILESRFSTRDPVATFRDVFDFFRAARAEHGELEAYGIASFGPLNINPRSAGYGRVTSTPKPGWSDFDLRGVLVREFGKPVGIDTDVNAAGLAEARWGNGVGLPSLVYVTVGTGLGVGIIYQGQPLLGLTHPEMGHIHVRRHPRDLQFAGVCPFHGDCLEGLACGPAIVARTGRSLAEASDADEIWEIEADYLGQLCAQLVSTVSPHRILLGGGVMQQERLFGLMRARMRHWLGSYNVQPEIHEDGFLRAPGLGNQAGVKGALALAMDAASRGSQ